MNFLQQTPKRLHSTHYSLVQAALVSPPTAFTVHYRIFGRVSRASDLRPGARAFGRRCRRQVRLLATDSWVCPAERLDAEQTSMSLMALFVSSIGFASMVQALLRH